MNEKIGQAAGTVWRNLNQNGSSGVKKISAETGLKPKDVERALGWLAREEKIRIFQQGRKEQISLIGS